MASRTKPKRSNAHKSKSKAKIKPRSQRPSRKKSEPTRELFAEIGKIGKSLSRRVKRAM